MKVKANKKGNSPLNKVLCYLINYNNNKSSGPSEMNRQKQQIKIV